MEIEDTELCEEHLRERAEEDAMERRLDAHDYDEREYGQYETDSKGSY